MQLGMVDVNPVAVSALEVEGAIVRLLAAGDTVIDGIVVEYGMMASAGEGVPAPVITTVLYERFQSWQLGEITDHAEKK